MPTLPLPLHPAVVHFPIVLLLFGSALTVVEVFVNRWRLAWLAALLLVIGTLGAFSAVQTGKAAQDMLDVISSGGSDMLEEHQEWAEKTQWVAAAAAFLALFAASLEGRLRGTRETPAWVESGPAWHGMLRVITAGVALFTCFCVYQTAHRGGKLVYDYGVGVKVKADQAEGASAPTHE